MTHLPIAIAPAAMSIIRAVPVSGTGVGGTSVFVVMDGGDMPPAHPPFKPGLMMIAPSNPSDPSAKTSCQSI
jgi:hypothetical protein